MDSRYAPLFDPYTLNNGVGVKNRLVVAPLTIYDAAADGGLTPAAREFWRDRFRGFGMYIMPFTNVHPSGVGFASPHAFSEEHLANLEEYARIAHEQGALSIVQLAHAGLRSWPSDGQVVPLAPTGDTSGRVRGMSTGQVQEMADSFAYAAELALRAGHDGVEIHGANGWLVQQFVSAATNLRDDEWGGSFESRIRFPLAVVDAVDRVKQRYKRPDFILGYRFSPEEPGERGITMGQSLGLVDALVKKPLQYLHVSLWDFYKRARRGADTAKTRMQLIHDRIDGRLPLIGVGNLLSAEQMVSAYETGWAEFIALGKAVMLNPSLVELIESGRTDEIETRFDWNKALDYRYTPAMLQGTYEGNAMFTESINKPELVSL